MKNKKGFTLIELLAVIVILGVIMVIAVPAVTKYINQSRKDSFASTAEMYIDAAQKAISAGDLTEPTTSSSAPLKIFLKDLEIQKGGKESPFGGEYYLDSSYIKVTSDNQGNLTYRITMSDKKDNSIINKTLEEIKKQGRNIVVNKKVDFAATNKVYNLGDKVTINGSDFYVIEQSSEEDSLVTLISNLNVKADGSFDTTAKQANFLLSDAEITSRLTNCANKLNTDLNTTGITAKLLTLEEAIDIIGGTFNGSTYDYTKNDWFFAGIENSWLIGNRTDEYNNVYRWRTSEWACLAPSLLTTTEEFGIRPVITIDKEYIK